MSCANGGVAASSAWFCHCQPCLHCHTIQTHVCNQTYPAHCTKPRPILHTKYDDHDWWLAGRLIRSTCGWLLCICHWLIVCHDKQRQIMRVQECFWCFLHLCNCFVVTSGAHQLAINQTFPSCWVRVIAHPLTHAHRSCGTPPSHHV